MVGREDVTNAVGLNSAHLQRVADRRPGDRRAAHRRVRHLGRVPHQRRQLHRRHRRLPGDARRGAAAGRAGGPPDVGRAASSRTSPRARATSARRRSCCSAVVVVGLAATFGMNFQVLVPPLADDVLHVGASGFGFLMAASGVGSTIAALGVAFQRRVGPGADRLRRDRARAGLDRARRVDLVRAVAARDVRRRAPARIAMAVTANTTIQLAVPDQLRGRVMSVYTTVFAGSVPVGGLLMGSIASAWSVPAALMVGALVTLAIGHRLARSGCAGSGISRRAAARSRIPSPRAQRREAPPARRRSRSRAGGSEPDVSDQGHDLRGEALRVATISGRDLRRRQGEVLDAELANSRISAAISSGVRGSGRNESLVRCRTRPGPGPTASASAGRRPRRRRGSPERVRVLLRADRRRVVAVAQPSGPLERSVGSATDQDRQRGALRRQRARTRNPRDRVEPPDERLGRPRPQVSPEPDRLVEIRAAHVESIGRVEVRELRAGSSRRRRRRGPRRRSAHRASRAPWPGRPHSAAGRR